MSNESTGWQPPSEGSAPGAHEVPSPQHQPQYGAYGTPPPGQYPPPGAQQPSPGPYPGAGFRPYGPGVLGDPRPGIIPLRPLSIGEIIAGAFEAMRANPRAMFLPSLVVMAAMGMASALITYLLTSRSNPLIDYPAGGTSEAESLRELQSLLVDQGAANFASGLLNGLAAAILTGLLIVAVSRMILGRVASAGEIWERTRSRVPALIGQTLLITLIQLLIMAGAAAVMIPLAMLAGEADSLVGFLLILLLGIALGSIAILAVTCRLCLAPAALILENIGVIEGIRRSWALTRGYFWRVLGIQILAWLIVSFTLSLLSGMIGGVIGVITAIQPEFAAAGYALAAFVGSVISAFVLPFSAAVVALTYTDVRMRSEGLDIELRRAAGA
ncbi:glycerophosphoryl diester phosphodiesterase membrane domain-containing protein [Actinomyces slackii]|uniref:Predicted integral membrane protein n=1 Tax=Actinomyces slackii TaxID=52774 RepID=A0A3S4SLW2_9ACTO|nr:glycerophosphoryl diester phosphodiesterase membrane domain-containing protein [Actinomyces slackii]VEG75837.1 Predicted integral membrane protein [Actinomyces slackii]